MVESRYHVLFRHITDLSDWPLPTREFGELRDWLWRKRLAETMVASDVLRAYERLIAMKPYDREVEIRKIRAATEKCDGKKKWR